MPHPRTSDSDGPSTPDLDALLGSVAKGEEDALERLYDATSRWIHGFVWRILRDREEAEEVTLDVYMKVWSAAASFDPGRGKATTWLMRIARNRAIDRLRSRRAARLPEQRNLEVTEVCDRANPGPAAAAVARERDASVRAALETLPERQRRAIDLAFFGGLSHSEIAARLDQPLGTVKTNIRLGMVKLRGVLHPSWVSSEAASG
jgi:RNA polymerase sigma-70 factor (ECF subfamily)